jgi:beta-lactamase superfamily II metal-dependent hydrolase
MPKITFYPLGNADSTLIDLRNGEKLLFDYANRRIADDKSDKRIDLPTELRKDLGTRDYFDIVAFTHLDQDHYDGTSEFFYLEHDKAYQGKVEGKTRIKMNTMWVPAAVITEELKEEESKVIQAEAQYRLKQKKGIRVFSSPNRLAGWLKDNGMKLAEIEHLLTDAGGLAPEFTIDDDDLEIRNDDALVMQATFREQDVDTKLLLFADICYEVIDDIVKQTKYHSNEERLEWDVFKIPHHCSYTAIGPDKGVDKTEPSDNVDWLYRDQGQSGGTLVSTSKPIPRKGTDEDKDVQPPHREAANFYRDIAKEKSGEFLVTMEHPSLSQPKPIIVEIDHLQAMVKKSQIFGPAAAASVSAPRAG